MSSGFVAGTLVHTDKGLVPIQNLKVGDLVLSKNEFDGTKSFKPVENIFRYEQEEIFVLRFIDNFIEPDENDFFYTSYESSKSKAFQNSLGIFSTEPKNLG